METDIEDEIDIKVPNQTIWEAYAQIFQHKSKPPIVTIEQMYDFLQTFFGQSQSAQT